jgi:hypothetical protein
MQQFVDGKMAQQQQGVEPQNAGKEFLMQGFKQIAETMQKMATVIQTISPELMPLFVKSVTALKMVEQEFAKQTQGQGQQAAASEPPPQAGGAEGAEAMSM